jgi:hypothetical protein
VRQSTAIWAVQQPSAIATAPLDEPEGYRDGGDHGDNEDGGCHRTNLSVSKSKPSAPVRPSIAARAGVFAKEFLQPCAGIRSAISEPLSSQARAATSVGIYWELILGLAFRSAASACRTGVLNHAVMQ